MRFKISNWRYARSFEEAREQRLRVSTLTFTKSLAQILSRDIGFYDIVATQKGYFKAITLTLTLAIIPTLTPALMSTVTLTQGVDNEIFV